MLTELFVGFVIVSVRLVLFPTCTLPNSMLVGVAVRLLGLCDPCASAPVLAVQASRRAKPKTIEGCDLGEPGKNMPQYCDYLACLRTCGLGIQQLKGLQTAGFSNPWMASLNITFFE